MNRASRVRTGSPPTATVTLVGFVEEDREFLESLLDCPTCVPSPDCTWAVQPRASVAATLRAVRRDRTPVVLCDRDLLPEAWKELLEEFAGLPEPPCLIVTSRLADEHLWAEALNLGAYDVLGRPFDGAEVLRTVSLAWLHWQSGRTSRAHSDSPGRFRGNYGQRVSAA